MLHQQITERLYRIYPPEDASFLAKEIEQLIASFTPPATPARSGWTQRDAMLFAYGDSITTPGVAPLQALHATLTQHVGDAISFLHLLPFYPYSSDDGFAVKDFRSVREDLGDWNDIARLAEDYRLVFDGVINHVSASSFYAHGYLAGDPTYEDFFIALPPDTDTRSVLRTRNLPLLHEYQAHDGPRWLWTTFSADQLDFNMANPRVLLEILSVLLDYARHGAAMIRLDAIPYLWKELGTSCAHLPQTHELIKLIRDLYDRCAPHVLLLTETNVPHKENIAYFGDHGDEAQMIYNFTLAPLILWSLHSGSAETLTSWAEGLEWMGQHATYLNITATHDGIGMRPTEGILSEDERGELVALATANGGDITGKRNPDGSVSPYELNITYYDALNAPDANESQPLQIARFLCSQAIPMSLMGIPGIYIHSLFGSRNDLGGVKTSGRARSINRAQLDQATLTRELHTSESIRAQVFRGMMAMLRLRQEQAAFHPDAGQEILSLHSGVFAVRRTDPSGHIILALHNCRSESVSCSTSGMTDWQDLLNKDRGASEEVQLTPYQVRWLKPSTT